MDRTQTPAGTTSSHGGRGGRGSRGDRGGFRGGRGGFRGGRGGAPFAPPERAATRLREESECARLAARWAAEAPPPGSSDASAAEFSELPLSHYTLTALKRHGFTRMTAIQRLAIPHACARRDVLGAAKTGSGKTLAFLVPLLERLYHERWSAEAGLGALVVSPTRELAMQTFEVLRRVGEGHFALSAGLLTGGKDFEEESAAVGALSIIVATPGRLLQHLEQSVGLDATNLQVLVLDEADRLMDLGFSETVNAVLRYLPPPPGRLTLLFSATQTRSVRDLARLSLADPQFVAVHEAAAAATPARLAQAYMVCPAPDKLNLIFSFLRSHVSAKVIVFVSSCKEARFVFEAMRRLRPGLPLQLLHGKMKQTRRMLVYYDFLKKPAAALFATDIAARGLDFPGVDWVLQADAPEDAAAYIHRVGRAARFKAKGSALLLLTPGEEAGMAALLAAAKVPIRRTHVAPSAAVSITGKLAAEVAADPELKVCAQRAFTSYVRSVALQPNKTVFKLRDIDGPALAESFGLAAPPESRLGALLGGGGGGGGGCAGGGEAAELDEAQTAELRAQAHARKNENKGLARLKAKIAEERAAKRGEGKRSEAAGAPAEAAVGEKEEEGDAGGLLRPKAQPGAALGGSGGAGALALPAEALGRLSDKERARIGAIARDTLLLGAGGAHRGADGMTPFERIAAEKGGGRGRAAPELASAASEYAQRVAARLEAAAAADRERERARVRTKHQEERAEEKPEATETGGYTLGGDDDEDEDEGDDDDDDDDDDDGDEDGEEGEEEGGGEEKEEDEPPPRPAQGAGGKRVRGDAGGGSGEGGSRAAKQPREEHSVKDLEARALSILKQKKR